MQSPQSHDAFGIHGIPTHDPETGNPQTGFLRALRVSWNEDCWEDAPEGQPPPSRKKAASCTTATTKKSERPDFCENTAAHTHADKK